MLDRRGWIRQAALVVALSVVLDLIIIMSTLSYLGIFKKDCKNSTRDYDFSKCRRRVCYYLSLEGNHFKPNDLNATLCTHVHYAYGNISNNRIEPFFFSGEVNCSSLSQGYYHRINKLKRKHNGLKTLISVGGLHYSSELSLMAKTHKGRQEFADSSVLFLERYDFDGLDLHWVFTKRSPPSDREQFTFLVQQLRSTLDNHNAYVRPADSPLLLTAALVPGDRKRIEMAYELDRIHPLLDYISVMTYSFHGPWNNVTGHNSPLYSKDNASIDWAARYYSVERGVPPRKLVLAISTIAWSFKLLDPGNSTSVGEPTESSGLPEGTGTFLSYGQVCRKRQGEIRNRSLDQRVPYLVSGDQWISYDDVDSVKEKADYVMKNGYGGVVFWTPSRDDPSGQTCGQGPFPLMTAVNDIICPHWTLVDTGDYRLQRVTEVAGKSQPAKCSTSQPVCQRQVCTYVTDALSRAQGQMYPEDVNAALCSHLRFQGAGLRNNSLALLDEHIDYSGLMDQTQRLRNDNPNLKILLTVGGDRVPNSAFAHMVSSDVNRSKFVEDALGFLKTFHFDGLDVLSWNVDEAINAVDKENYTLLLQELRGALDLENLMLTATVHAGPESAVLAAYEVDKIHRYVDFLNLMTFDFYAATGTRVVAPHSPLHACDKRSVVGGAQLWLKKGVPRNKLVLGISTNARVLKLKDASRYDVGDEASLSDQPGPYTSKAGYRTYFGVCRSWGRLGRLNWNEVPFLLSGDTWISFDDVQSVTAKACYARNKGFGGVMAWTLADDDFMGQFCGEGRYPLWKAVNKVCREQ